MTDRKAISLRINKARDDEDIELVSMLEIYYQLKFNYIPQIQKRFLEPDAAGLFTPHRCKIRKEVIVEEYKKLIKNGESI